jgi:hypothetical protein
VVSNTGAKLEIQCLNPFWDSQMPHSTVSKKPISKFFNYFHLFSFFSDVQLWPPIFSDFLNNIKVFENLPSMKSIL